MTAEERWWPSPFGADDQHGMLNHLTDATRLAALGLVREGRMYDLGRVLDEAVPVFPGRHFRQTLDARLSGPNGIALSPDERYLYVGNWDPERRIVVRYPVDASGAVGAGEVFFDMAAAPGEDAVDGLDVDRAGNLYVCGPSGIWLLSPDGAHLGALRLPHPRSGAPQRPARRRQAVHLHRRLLRPHARGARRLAGKP
jgi:SMP-30/Gluconolactonase/LRE-like region